MSTIWQLDNFVLGIHSQPGNVKGGSRYAADISNLAVDENGWLRLRSNFRSVGTGGANITGVAASNTHLFILREDGKLYFRSLDDLDSETEITGVSNLSGRLSVISAFRDYIMLTSEGTDQGFWVDFREGEARIAHTLGIEPPTSDAWEIAQSVPPLDTDYTALVAYAITYVREFEAASGEVQPDELFNGMESELSDAKYVFTLREPVGKLQIGTSNLDASWIWTSNNLIGPGEGGRDGETIIVSVIDTQGRNHQQEMLNALPRLAGTELEMSPPGIRNQPGLAQISGSIASVPDTIDTHLRVTLTGRTGADFSDGNAFHLEFHSAATALGFPVTDRYYPALLQNFTFPADFQITGINIYRSQFLYDSPDFTRVQRLIDNDSDDLDLNALQFRKVDTVSRIQVPAFVADGIQISTEDGETVLNPYRQRLNALGETPSSSKAYVWSDQTELSTLENKRLPSEVQQFILYNDRIFGASGDRLVYSDIDFADVKLWAFPSKNAIRRSRPGRIDFVAEHREVLLFGGRDGLYRLTGTDAFDFRSDEISHVGPLDGFAWSTTIDTLGFVGENGLYLTDGVNTELSTKIVLDNFFKNKRTRRGTMLFFSDDTLLFSAGLQPVNGGDITDYLFRFNDGHWIRWSGQEVQQVAVVGEDWSQYWIVNGGSELIELEWNEGNTDADLEWWWESNWIHGRAAGVQNEPKQFNELGISAASGTTMMLSTWVDNDTDPITTEFVSRDDLYTQFVPIERIGERLRFRLSGTGPLTIRGIQIEN